jgi:hypothetical protein
MKIQDPEPHPDLDPRPNPLGNGMDPRQNFIDAQHCFYLKSLFGILIQKSKTRLTQIEKNKNIFQGL